MGSISRIKYTVVLICILLISGCVALGSKPADPNASFVPAPNAPAGYVNLYIVRTYAQPTARGMSVYVNDRKVVKLGNYSYSWVSVKPGRYIIRSEWGWDTGKPKLEFEVNVTEEKYLAFGGGAEHLGDTTRWTSEAYEIPVDSVHTELKGTVIKKPIISTLVR